MMKHEIRLTDAAKEAAKKLEEEEMAIRFCVTRSGCCSMSVVLYPDRERVNDKVIEVDGVRILSKDEYPDLQWNGTIDYKDRGLHKGFRWK